MDHRAADVVDQRLAFLNQTQFRNDIELFAFRPEVDAYGTGAIRIVDAASRIARAASCSGSWAARS